MHIIYYPRQHGKTQELIKRAEADPNGLIVTSNLQQANLINKQVGRKLAVPYFDYGRGYNKTIYIDNLEYVLSAVFHNKVDTITMSNEEVTIDEKYNQQVRYEY